MQRFILFLVSWLLFMNLCWAEYPYANPRKHLEAIPWLEQTQRRQDQIWRAKYDAAQPTVGYRSRVVSYAGKWTRHSFGGHGGLGGDSSWRYAAGPLTPRVPWQEIGQLLQGKVDVDGDGSVEDDFVFSLPFSMEVPLSIPDWPAANVFPERLNGKFYGGMTYYCGNNVPDQLGNFSGEMGINADHSPPFFDTRAEDHPMNGMRHKSIPDSFLKHYVTMLWKKEDFLNHGDKYRVSFDDESRLAILCTRGYWYGWNDVRFVVQNGEQFYISEIIDDVPDYAFRDAGKLGKPSGYLPVCYPTKTQWSRYEPDGYQIDFDASKASFGSVVFDDVRAMGWYLAKTDDSPQQTHAKWYGFEADALVHTPGEPSAHIEMQPIAGKRDAGDGAVIPDFNIAICEVPYMLWQDIYRWGDSPHHVLQARYIYDKSGSMGSMGYGKREHMHDEPLTDISFYDALALCNTLSEMEGKTPCYYLDAEFKTIFKNQHMATHASYGGAARGYQVRNFENPKVDALPEPVIYVRWGADGHRLPTVAEWMAARGEAPVRAIAPAASPDGTLAVGSGRANENGLYDIIGNVWELCWTFGDAYDPQGAAAVTALGGDFLYPASPADKPSSPYGDTPWDGDARIGLRLVSRDSGLPAPPMGKAAETSDIDMWSETPRWDFKKGDIVGKQESARPLGREQLPMVDIPGGGFVRHDKKIIQVAPFVMAQDTVTYDRWKTVRQWAEARGYDFYKNGDMGSMYFFDFTHSPDEPVTHLTWFDMITWCNALSEMEGLTPVFYEDEECTKVIRQAFEFRPIKVDGHEYIQLKRPYPDMLDGNSARPFIFTRWDVDGYRLPTAAEMEYAIRGGTETTYFWGDRLEDYDTYVWGPANAGGRTHPVGQKNPNPFGLYDIQGNVKEWLFSMDGKRLERERPYELDLDNPIASPFLGYKQPIAMYMPIGLPLLAGGPSFLYGSMNINGAHGVKVEHSSYSGMTHYYQDVSFRPVRCEAGTHPRNGLRPLAEKEIIQYLRINPEHFNALGQ